MKRILVIGSSHAGAVKAAWDEMKQENSTIELDFLVLPWPHLSEFHLYEDMTYGAKAPLAGQKAIDLSNTINGRETVSLTEYDLVFWVGYHSPVDALVRLMHNYAIDDVIEHDAPQRLSFILFREILMEFVNNCIPNRIWLDAAKQTKLVIHLCPIAAETCLAIPQNKKNWQIATANSRIFKRILELMMKRLSARLAHHNIDVVEQPQETLAENGMTKTEFSVGSIRLMNAEAHPEKDFSHMNSAYGRLLLNALFVKLGTTDKESPNRAAS
ncbi:hypothetical protein RB2150_07128 [Rhodobacterales bacterium HTCC2150]|nr:hypothetical protein RB2150_07128 [Rhodobacterales bacterium HTCC2150] [Rhodobacteraceae bacterium HTCC2150]